MRGIGVIYKIERLKLHLTALRYENLLVLNNLKGCRSVNYFTFATPPPFNSFFKPEAQAAPPAGHLSVPHIRAYASEASGSADSKRSPADTMSCDLSHRCGNRTQSSSCRICSGKSDCTLRIPVPGWDLQRLYSLPSLRV